MSDWTSVIRDAKPGKAQRHVTAIDHLDGMTARPKFSTCHGERVMGQVARTTGPAYGDDVECAHERTLALARCYVHGAVLAARAAQECFVAIMPWRVWNCGDITRRFRPVALTASTNSGSAQAFIDDRSMSATFGSTLRKNSIVGPFAPNLTPTVLRMRSLLRLSHCHKPQAVVETREWNVRIVLVSFVLVRNRLSQVTFDQLRETNHLPVNLLIRVVLVFEGVRHEDSPVCKRLYRAKRSSGHPQEVIVVLREPAGAAADVPIEHGWSRD